MFQAQQSIAEILAAAESVAELPAVGVVSKLTLASEFADYYYSVAEIDFDKTAESVDKIAAEKFAESDAAAEFVADDWDLCRTMEELLPLPWLEAIEMNLQLTSKNKNNKDKKVNKRLINVNKKKTNKNKPFFGLEEVVASDPDDALLMAW